MGVGRWKVVYGGIIVDIRIFPKCSRDNLIIDY